MGKEVKRQSVRKLFVERMKREGRGKEWFSTVKQVSKETGQRYGQAAWEAMRRLGYTGPEKERQLHQVFLENEDKTKLQRQIDAEQEQIKEEQITKNLEQAVMTLPNTAPISVDIEWIREHPAMMRMTRQKDKLKDILITAEDILRPPHGSAPSKSAVYALQHWVNHPQQFYKELFGEQKKHLEERKAAKADEDIGLEEIEWLLMQVTSRKGGAALPEADKVFGGR